MKEIKEETKEVRTKPKNDKIVVLVDLDHLPFWGHPSIQELTYRCNFEVSMGDKVLCPPTDLYPEWFVGVVVALDSNYNGYLKSVRKYKEKKNEPQD